MQWEKFVYSFNEPPIIPGYLQLAPFLCERRKQPEIPKCLSR